MMSLALIAVTGLLVAHEPTPPAAGALEPTPPRYVLDLTLEEFSVLHSAADHGVRTYGGHAAFKLDIFQAAQGPVWQVVIDEPKLLPVWTQWMAEKTALLVSLTDVDNLGEGDKLAYRITRSVTQKLRQAAEKPIYESIRIEGTALRLDDGSPAFTPEAADVPMRVTGRGAAALALLAGQRVVIDGVVRTDGHLDARGAFPLRPGTLEVFVISQCPFGKLAEKAIIERLMERSGSGGAETLPAVEFRYLFIPVDKTTTFTCMHGEGEVQENLVQMVLRDQFPSSFFPYLLRRAGNDAPWPEIARGVGLDQVAIDYIAAEIVRNREPLMTAEYAYWRERAIPMESPTYLWEGRVHKTLDRVPQMNGLALGSGSCGGR